ncbi:MAG: 3-deoxy-8-phosphooctulonate synthase [bacterium]
MSVDVESMLQSDDLFFIMGPCVIESDPIMKKAADELASLREEFSLPVIFKSSFDKANRTSLDSFRGPGLQQGLKTLEMIGDEYDFPLITDIHEPHQAEPVSEVVDVLQIPAFLCRQTDLIVEAGETGCPVNIKKGQFLDPESMTHSLDKVRNPENSNDYHLATERGSVFGYNRWVVDMRNLVTMREANTSIVYDATHSVQLPGARGGASGGQREFIAPQARAAVAVGIDGVFMETHPDPDEALCDGPNMLPLDQAETVVESLLAIHDLTGQNRQNQLIQDDSE